MALFNHATKEVTAKLVYYGPGPVREVHEPPVDPRQPGLQDEGQARLARDADRPHAVLRLPADRSRHDPRHPLEIASENPMSEWQWTQKRATFSFRNPKKDATFYLEDDARVDLFTPPQQVTVRIGDDRAEHVCGRRQGRRPWSSFRSTAAQFGTGIWPRCRSSSTRPSSQVEPIRASWASGSTTRSSSPSSR